MGTIHYSEGEFPLNPYGPCNGEHGYDGLYDRGNQWGTMIPPCHKHRSCECDCKAQLYITDIQVTENRSLNMQIMYSDGSVKTITIESGKKYIIKYIENGQLVQITGIIKAIGKVGTATTCTCTCCSGNDYVIEVDASTEGNSSVYTIRTSTIREISLYGTHYGEDTNLEISSVYGATVFGLFTSVRLKDCTIDNEGFITKGTIISADMVIDKSVGEWGCAQGKNNIGSNLVIIQGRTIKGTVIAGNIMAGQVFAPIVEGGKSGQGVVEGATVRANKARLVITNGDIIGGKTVNGVILNPVLENSFVSGGTRYGEDMITNGATVVGGKAYAGYTSGGTLYGGTATGFIDKYAYTIVDGETTGGSTTNAIVENGKIVGGNTIGTTTLGAIVYGGTTKAGTSIGGTTTLGNSGYIRPGYSSLPLNVTNPTVDYRKLLEKKIDELIIWWEKFDGRAYTNLSEYQGPPVIR